MAVEHNKEEEINEINAESAINIRFECEQICYQELRAVLTHHTLPLKKMPLLVQQSAAILARSKELKSAFNPCDTYKKDLRKLAQKCLERILKESYGIDLEAWRQEHRCGSGVTGPTNEEQLRRNKNLTDFIGLARGSDLVKRQTLNLADTMLESRFPVSIWNKNEVANDLAINFVFWALDNSECFTKLHKLVVYTIIFRGFDEKTIVQYAKRFGAKDGMDYGITPDAIRKAYDEVINIFKQRGPKLLNKFLKNADLNSSANVDLIPNYRQITAERSAAIKDSPKELLNAASLGRMDSERIAIPETALDLFLTDIDFVLLESGNITARNKTLVRLHRLIAGKVCKSSYGRSVILKYGIPDDFKDMLQEAAEECLRIFASVAVTEGGFIVYIQQRIAGMIPRRAVDLETVPVPPYVHEKLRYINKCPDETDEEIADHFVDPDCTSVKIEKLRAKFFRGSQLVYRKICTDEPINEESNGDTRGDFLPELSVPATALDEAEQEEIRRLSRAAIAELPPYHRFLLGQYFLKGKSFREIGEMIGVRRQAVEPIISRVKRRLKNGDCAENADETDVADPNGFNLESDVIIMRNRKAFDDWCLAQCPGDKKARSAFKAYLGLDKSVGYRRLKGSETYRHLERKSGRLLKAESRVCISGAISDLRETLRCKLLSVLPEKRFLDVVPERIMYKRAQAYLKRLRDGDALS